MPSLQTPLTTIVQFVDPKTGYLTNEGRTIIQQLIDRTGGATGGTLLFAGDETYGAPIGPLSRAALTTNPVLAVGAGYSQAQVTAIRDYLLLVAETLGALITDSQAVGVVQ